MTTKELNAPDSEYRLWKTLEVETDTLVTESVIFNPMDPYISFKLEAFDFAYFYAVLKMPGEDILLPAFNNSAYSVKFRKNVRCDIYKHKGLTIKESKISIYNV